MAIKILIHSNAFQQEQWLLKPTSSNIELVFYKDEIIDADLYIDNNFNAETSVFSCITTKPILTNTIQENLPHNFINYNGWNTCIKNNTIEIGKVPEIFIATIKEICEAANWKLFMFSNLVGLPIQRTISMIINEAYFALEANVSSKKDIDIAMKLGTNYPYGPFEWSEKIGLIEIYSLLQKLSTYDIKFTPCKLLEKEATTK